MKQIVCAVCCMALCLTSYAQDTVKKKKERVGKFHFYEETHDFGEVPEGPNAVCDFQFKNTGNAPIVISEAHGSCGCTVPNWSTEPVLPRHKGVIHVTYNTQGRVGPIEKEVIVTSNAQQDHVILHLRGTVVAAKKDDRKPDRLPAPPPPAMQQ